MSPLDVHVNRIPVSGTVEHLKYHEGKYLAAFDEHAMNKNERMEIGINSNYGKILFTQVSICFSSLQAGIIILSFGHDPG